MRRGPKSSLGIRKSPGGVRVYCERFVQKFIIDINFLPAQFDRFARQTDHPLDEVPLFIFGIFKNDDIVALWNSLEKGVIVKQLVAGKRNFVGDMYPITEFGYQDMVAHQKGVLHGPRRDFKGLDNKCTD